MQPLSPWFRTVRLVRGIRKVYETARPNSRSLTGRRVFKIVREPEPSDRRTEPA